MSERPTSVDRDLFEILRGGGKRGAALADVLWEHLPLEGRTLDIGVGAGVVANAVGADGRWVAGVDMAPARLRRAFRRLMGAAARADARALPFATGSFDAAYVVWLQILPDPPVIAEAARVLRPGGRLVIVTGPHTSRPEDEIGAVEAGVDALHPWREEPADVALRGVAAGLRLVARRQWVIPVEQSPEEAAEGIEGRDLATLWGLDPLTVDTAVTAATAELRSLPDPGTPRLRRIAYPLLVFERATT
jgi:SAM-dependent methyltransferase